MRPLPRKDAPSVLIFSGTPAAGSGAERVLEYLLRAPVSRDVIAGVIAPSSSAVFSVARECGFPVHHWPIHGESIWENLRAVPRFLRAFTPPPTVRTLHAWHTRGFEIVHLLGRKWNLPTTGTLHDHPQMRHSTLRKRVIHFAANRLERIALVSRALLAECHAAQWKVPLTVITNGLPDESPAPLRPDGTMQVGFVGLNAGWKGFSSLPRIVDETSALPIEWRLYGRPAKEIGPALAALLAAHPAQVLHVGYRSPREIFGEIDVLFHPSNQFDPFPTALLECARAGRACLATRVGGTEEIVEDRRTGLLFSPKRMDDAAEMLRILSDKSYRDQLGRAARGRFEREFSLERMAQGYIDFWR